MKDLKVKENLKGYETNCAKSRLIDIMNKLENAGFKKDAESLGKIIGRLESWQHK